MLNEAETRAKLIDPALHARGWTEDLIKREETAGAVEIFEGKPRRRSKGRVDHNRSTRFRISSKGLQLYRRRNVKTSAAQEIEITGALIYVTIHATV